MSDEALRGALFAQLLWLSLAVAGALLIGGSPRERLGLVRSRLHGGDVFLLVVGFLCLSAAADLTLRAWALRQSSPLESLDQMVRQAPTGIWAPLLILGVLPGIGEELLFRGFALRALTGLMGSAGAVLFSALLFGVAHGDPVHGGAALLLGLYLGAVAVFSRSVWPGIACHVANNSSGVLGLHSGVGVPVTWAGPVGIGLLVAVSVGTLAWAAWRSRRASGADAPPEGKGLQAAPRSAD